MLGPGAEEAVEGADGGVGAAGARVGEQDEAGVSSALRLGAWDLGVEEAINCLVADDLVSLVALQPAEPISLIVITLQLRPGPSSHPAPLLGISGATVDLAAAAALQLSRDRRWRAIHSCRNLPDRLSNVAKLDNRVALGEREPLIHSPMTTP